MKMQKRLHKLANRESEVEKREVKVDKAAQKIKESYVCTWRSFGKIGRRIRSSNRSQTRTTKLKPGISNPASAQVLFLLKNRWTPSWSRLRAIHQVSRNIIFRKYFINPLRRWNWSWHFPRRPDQVPPQARGRSNVRRPPPGRGRTLGHPDPPPLDQAVWEMLTISEKCKLTELWRMLKNAS